MVFLVLAALAAVLYGGTKEQQQKMEQNFFWKETRQAALTLWSAATGLADASANPDQTLVEKWREKIFSSNLKDISDQAAAEQLSASTVAEKTGAVRDLWSQFVVKITGHKQTSPDGSSLNINSQTIDVDGLSSTVNGGLETAAGALDSADTIPTSSISDFLVWEKNDNGATLILKWKNGREYKLPLPFKFLSR